MTVNSKKGAHVKRTPAVKVLMISFTSFIQKFYQTLPHEIARQSGWEVRVLVPPYWKELWSRERRYLEKDFDELYDIVVGKIWFAGNLHLAMFRSHLKFLLIEYQPDIIDMENEVFNLGSWQIARLRNRYSPHSKLVLHASQHQFKNYPPPFNLVEKYVLRHADAILARNGMAVEVLRQKGYQGRVEIITHGVNSEAFRPRQLPELCGKLKTEDKLLVGYVGSLVEHKGVHLLLQALEGLPVRLLVVGDGTMREELKKQAVRLGVELFIIPSASHEEVAQYMNCMDIFVLPSLTRPNWVEKFGRVLIEAMSSGVPVIGSSCGEIPNVLGNAGLVFPEGDVAALRKKLQILLEDESLRHRLGWAGRRRVLEQYAWNVVAARTIRVYRELLNLPEE